MSASLDSDIAGGLRIDARVASLLLFVCCVWVLEFSIPQGINQNFLNALLLPCSLVAALALLASRYLVKPKPAPSSSMVLAAKFPVGDLLLLSLPLTPVVQFVLLNQESMSSLDNLGLVLGGLALFAVLTLLLPWLLRRWISYPVFVILASALIYCLANMAAMASAYQWHLAGEFLPQFGLWLAVVVLTGVLYRIDRKALLGLAALFFVASVGNTWLQGPADGLESTEEALVEHRQTLPWHELYSGQQMKRKPSIFLMTYDSYVENETLLQYGIDNSAQEQFLRDSGFKLYPGVYSLASSSRASMSRVLGSQETLRGVAGFSPMLDLLKANDYTTKGFFQNDYFFSGVGVGYDQSFPPPSPPSFALARAVVEGQFRHNVSFKSYSHDEFVRSKRLAIEAATHQPTFLYTHTGPGHSQNSGKCRDEEIELFRERLEVANLEMRADLASIQANYPDALVIVNGDHGPYLTKNCVALSQGPYRMEEVTPLDIQDRFGTFLAIRWPQARQGLPDDGLLLLQDVFPAVFAYLYDQPMSASVRFAPNIGKPWNLAIGGVSVSAGVVEGGSGDGERLFKSANQ